MNIRYYIPFVKWASEWMNYWVSLILISYRREFIHHYCRVCLTICRFFNTNHPSSCFLYGFILFLTRHKNHHIKCAQLSSYASKKYLLHLNGTTSTHTSKSAKYMCWYIYVFKSHKYIYFVLEQKTKLISMRTEMKIYFEWASIC